jgi:O-antigen ligase
MIRRIRAFGAFWFDFIIGDDWVVGLGVTLALAITFAVGRSTNAPVWWVIVVAVAILLPLSVFRVTRHRR